jgi:hypothetical protein
MESTKCLQALASFSTRQTSRPALPCWLGLFISSPVHCSLTLRPFHQLRQLGNASSFGCALRYPRAAGSGAAALPHPRAAARSAARSRLRHVLLPFSGALSSRVSWRQNLERYSAGKCFSTRVPYVGERRELHDVGNDDRARRWPRPVRIQSLFRP